MSSKELLSLLVELEQLQVLLSQQLSRSELPSSPSPSTSPSTSPSPTSLLHHESRIIHLASQLSYRLREYETSLTNWSKLDPILADKFCLLIKEYLLLMKESKSSSSFKCCQCFSSKTRNQQNISKEERYALIESKLIEGIFVIRINMIQSSMNQLLLDYQYAQKFSLVLSDISSTTAFFTIQDTVEGKYSCREKLRKLFYSLDEYKSEFIHSRLGRIDDTPKRFRDIQEGLQVSHENPNIKKEYRQINRYLHDLSTLGTKLLSYQCEKKADEVSNLISMTRVAEHDQIDSFQTLESSYSSQLVSKLTPHFCLIKEFMETNNHNLTTSLVELAHRWSLLRANISSSTFLSSYFGSGDEDLDEMFPNSTSATSATTTRPPMKPSSSSKKFLSSSGSTTTPERNTSNSDSADENFSLQMKKIFLDSFNNNTTTSTPSPTPPPLNPNTSVLSSHSSHNSSAPSPVASVPVPATAPSSSFFTITGDSTHSSYSNSNYSSHSMEESGGASVDLDSDEKITQLKNKFKSSFSSVAQKASKAAASAAAIASNSTQKAVILAAEAKNKVTNRPRRGSRGSGGLMMMTGSYTALVDMN